MESSLTSGKTSVVPEPVRAHGVRVVSGHVWGDWLCYAGMLLSVGPLALLGAHFARPIRMGPPSSGEFVFALYTVPAGLIILFFGKLFAYKIKCSRCTTEVTRFDTSCPQCECYFEDTQFDGTPGLSTNGQTPSRAVGMRVKSGRAWGLPVLTAAIFLILGGLSAFVDKDFAGSEKGDAIALSLLIPAALLIAVLGYRHRIKFTCSRCAKEVAEKADTCPNCHCELADDPTGNNRTGPTGHDETW